MFNPEFVFDPKTNTYTRYQAGEKHLDETTNKAITPKTVIALVMPSRIVDSVGHYGYQTSGSGKAIIFQDGRAIKATWKKKNRTDSLKLINENGNEVKLNKGQSWISLVNSISDINYN